MEKLTAKQCKKMTMEHKAHTSMMVNMGEMPASTAAKIKAKANKIIKRVKKMK